MVEEQRQLVLDLESAYQLAIEGSPLRSIISARQAVADGQIEQAGLLPNPELQIEFENFLGSGPFDGASCSLIFVIRLKPLFMGLCWRRSRCCSMRNY